MKLRTTFQMRCLAFAMALVLVITSSGLGQALQVFAVESDTTTINIGELVANNYDLTDAEKELLSSGLLMAEDVVYATPDNEDGLIVIDKEHKTVTVATYDAGHGNTWIPVSAKLVANGEDVEIIDTIVDNEFAYTYGGNAFSVEVKYVLNVTVDTGIQETLLNTGAWLKDGIANTDTVSGQGGNLYILEQAMPQLVELATNGVETPLGPASFDQEMIDAVNSLNAQMTANEGKLNLSVMIEEYDGGHKTEYLLTKGSDMKAEVNALVGHVSVISAQLNAMVEELGWLISQGHVSAEVATQLRTLAGTTGNLATGLADVNAKEWTAAGKTELVVADCDYATLDTLVAALGDKTAVSVNETLKVAETTLQQNLDMFNVTIKVVLNVVKEEVGSTELVEYASIDTTVTMLKGATKAEILAEIEAIGIEADAMQVYGEAYVGDHYVVVKTELAEEFTLTEDLTYTITYSPSEHTITLSYGDAMTVPCGFQYQLPVHEDPTKAYDYEVNNDKHAQGEIITITRDTEITRSAGKAYTSTDLYTVIADNYGNDIAQAILKSGALKDNVAINVRKPDPADAESLLKLEFGVLSAEDYNAAYEGLYWHPYSYGKDSSLENLFSGNTAEWGEKSAKVRYRLDLTNFTQGEVKDIVDAAIALRAEAKTQKSTLDAFYGNYDTIGQLDKAKLGALTGVIDVTDFTPGDGTETDAENLELRAYFKAVVGDIMANNLDTNNKLKIYNMLTEYNNNGLSYYYKNAEAFINEIDSLAGYLSQLLDEEEALQIMVAAAGFPEYVEDIKGLEEKLNTVQTNLSTPDPWIDLNSDNLGKLVTALLAEGQTEITSVGVPYLWSEDLMIADSTQVFVQIIIETPNGNRTIQTPALDNGTVLTQNMVNTLKAEINAAATELGVNDQVFYSCVTSANLDAMVGTALTEKVNIYYTYSVKDYKVIIDGEEDQIINIDDLEINLPKHPTDGWKYEYTVDGVENIVADTYTFTTEQVKRLFTSGSYTITRVEINENQEKLEESFEDWLSVGADGQYDLNAKVDANKDGIMGFAMTIINSGYTYIELNGEPLLYLNEENALEISLQTLVNAILNDNSFGSDTLINLGKNGKGKLLVSTMSVGNSAAELHYEDMDFVLELTSAPAAIGTVAKGLETIKPYMTFNSQDGIMNIDITLPEKAYEAYLAGMLVTGNLEKTNLAAMNDKIAFEFLWDYVDTIINTDANTTTFTNTLKKLGQNYNLAGYEDYYQMIKKALKNPGVVITPEDDYVDLSITGKGKTGIDAIINMLGVDVSAFSTYLSMIKEYKVDSNNQPIYDLSAAAVANLTNDADNYEAAVIDVSASGFSNKADFTANLPGRIDDISGYGAVILVGDVDGNLVIAEGATVILDLNGFKVDGDIIANGNVYIVDSSLDSETCGHVTGEISGNVTIIAGVYDDDVDAFVKDGYVQQENGAVTNALYSIVSDGSTITFEINSDVVTVDNGDLNSYIPNARALAVDIAVDLILNSYTVAALTVEGDLYDVEIPDIIALIAGTDRLDTAIETVLGFIDVPGMNTFANAVLKDLLTFGDLHDAFANETPFATYQIATAPWDLTVDHITSGNYITFGISSNEDLAEEYTVNLKLVGSNKDKVLALLAELRDHVKVEATVNLVELAFADEENKLSVEGTAALNVTLKFNHDEYRTIIAVLLANGNPDKAEALITALNSGVQGPLKEAFDGITVEELFNALKAVNRNTDFAQLCTDLGVTIDIADAARVENLYQLILAAAGKALETLDITGRDSVMGNLDKDADGKYDGTYVWTYTITRSPEASVRGYSVYAEASATVTLTLELFDGCDHLNTEVVGYEPAGCEIYGYTGDTVCKDCGKVLAEGEPIDPHGHSFTEYKYNNDATCTKDGTETAECDHGCGTTDTRTAEGTVVDHTYGPWQVVYEPSEEHDGLDERFCTVCGHRDTRTTTYVPPTGDEFAMTLYIGLMVLSVGGLAGLGWYYLAKKKNGRYSK